MINCNDCGAVLNEAELIHGQEGYGHEGKCCDCYDESIYPGYTTLKRKGADNEVPEQPGELRTGQPK